MKVLIAGEASVHLRNYCTAIRPYLDTMYLIAETVPNVPETDRSEVVSIRSSNPWAWFSALRSIKKIIAETQPDVIHLHQVNRLALLVSVAARGLGVPIVTTAWGSDVLLVPKRNFVFRFLTRSVLRSSRKITADARVMIDEMLKLDDDSSKYVHLQYGIDPVTPAVKEKIIYSNRLHEPLYNIDTILRDFAVFSKKHPDWRLVVAATGSQTQSLRQLADELSITDRITFAGWLDTKQNHANYAKASIYVSIPSSDGTSVSLLEAMSADCIPVVSDLPVTKEWVRDGYNGIIRKKGSDPFEAALLLDQERCFGYNRELTGGTVNRKNTTKEFFKIYQEVLTTAVRHA